ncbi:polyprenol phosphomannose-dependent alpha 1,6 mannosyltransferase MptB [Nocardioides hankookensis]|uniref:Polyprenol phosphomannose-dependent alpha 1,6 mannosyltransferase MptB n=1 Tax=Nocardioides hankookensis TaxID=443157 RepID=A0ABW1LD09_9ACTN
MILRGAIGSTLVLVGGLVTQVLPWTSPVATAPVLETLRESQAGRMTGLVVVVGGLAMLGSAWLRLLAEINPDHGSLQGGATALRLRLVHKATAAWSLPLLLAPPMFSRDGWSYAAQGALTHIGLSPYIWTPSIFDGQIREGVDPLWMNTPTPYGPVPLAWGSMVAGISDNPWLMVIGYRLLGVVGLLLLAWAVPRLAARTGQDVARASALVLACPLTVVHGIGGVHNDLVMAGLMAAAVAIAFDRPWVLGAALAGAAAAVKLPGGVVAIGVALVSLPTMAALAPRLRRLTSVGAVAVGVLVGTGVVIGVGIGWIHALDTPGIVRTPLSISTQVGAQLGRFGRIAGIGPVEDHALSVVRTLGLLVAIGIAVWMALRGRTGDQSDVVRSMGLLTLAVVLLSPAVHGWYLLWSLPFLASYRWGRPGDEALRDAALLLGIVAPLDSSLRGAPTEILVVAILVVMTAIRLRIAQAGHARRSRSSLAA